MKDLPDGVRPLSTLCVGEQARVADLSGSLQGFSRRRLLDLGLTAGTVVTCELVSPFGDPTAYRIRGAVVALRHEDASLVLVAHIVFNNPSEHRPVGMVKYQARARVFMINIKKEKLP